MNTMIEIVLISIGLCAIVERLIKQIPKLK